MVTWESSWQPIAARPFDRVRVVDEAPVSAVALPRGIAIAFAVMSVVFAAFIMSFGGEAVIVGLVVIVVSLLAAMIGLIVTSASRRAVITVDEAGFSLRYSRLRREVRATPLSIVAARACSLPSMPLYGRNWWFSFAGRGRSITSGPWRVSPLDLTPDRAFTPRDARTGEPVDIPGVLPCGVGSQGIVVVTRVSEDALGVFTDHGEEVADALTALIASAHPRRQRKAGGPVLPAYPTT
jgi:hypothetical protein